MRKTLATLLVVTLCQLVQVAHAASIQIEISGVPNKPAHVLFKLINNSATEYSFLPWRTPLESQLSDDIFSVSANGTKLPYLGRTTKRRSPTPSDFIVVKATESVSKEIDLSKYYGFSQAGAYQIQYRGHLLELKGNQVSATNAKQNSGVFTESIEVDSNQLSLDITSPLPPKETPNYKTAFGQCNNQQQVALNTAHNRARSLSSESQTALENASNESRPSAARYKRWFGSYSASRYNKAIATFKKMNDVYASKTVQYLCDCTPQDESEGIQAFVFSNDPYNIHICNGVFSSPTSGSESQAGILIHELSHFAVTGNTNDHAYGVSASIALANSKPSQAVSNADNYLFFAENIPALTNGEAATVTPPTVVPTEPEKPTVIAPIIDLILAN